MSFLNKIQSKLKSNINEEWHVLNDMSQLDEVDEKSKDGLVVLFKHSVTCGISAGAKHRIESEWENLDTPISFYYLDLLAYRPISNAIADRYQVIHQSPQIIVIKDGVAVYDTSHHKISMSDLNDALARVV